MNKTVLVLLTLTLPYVAAVRAGEHVLTFDRAKLYAQAVEESLMPIQPGVPGKTVFWNRKAAGFIHAPAFDFEPVPGAAAYRFTARTAAGREFTFVAAKPWAPLSPIWKELPVGQVELKVEGLAAKGGKVLATAKIDGKPSRTFHRKAVFNGPYQEAAGDYGEAAYRWLKWLSKSHFKGWNKEGDAGKLEGYPAKSYGSAVSGLAVLASLEKGSFAKEWALRMSRNAARTLIKGSYPADWALAGFPPTYAHNAMGNMSYGTVMMHYPAAVGNHYLVLYEATREKEFLEAARRIADVYRKTQLENGTWHLLVEGETGEKTARSASYVIPFAIIGLCENLARHGYGDYEPMATKAWAYIETDILSQFRFEGQFEDTGAAGGSAWNLSHYPANQAALYLFRHAQNDPARIALAEEALRFAEDQFVVWEESDRGLIVDQFRDQFIPGALEQYKYMVAINASAADFITTWQAAYEATGNELHLAKAVAFANAMTAIQKKSGGDFVSTYWRTGKGDGNWPNCHVGSSRALLDFDVRLKARGMSVPANGPK